MDQERDNFGILSKLKVRGSLGGAESGSALGGWRDEVGARG